MEMEPTMTDQADHEAWVEQIWHNYLTKGENDVERRQRRILKFLPGTTRCKNCYAPFEGIGGQVTRLVFGKRPSHLNPLICNLCETFAEEYQGGAEVELSLLFADVRGSTTLAESMSPKEFSKLINRFYNTATHVMVHSDALIDKIIGDQAAGIYVPGIAGKYHASRAIEAAKEILSATGHNQPGGSWIPLGVGVHTGTAYVGAVGSDGSTVDITVLGDAPNTAARLASSAAQGEILISASAYQAANMDLGALEVRDLSLKGKTEITSVHVLTNFK
jgi:adenylate cyclase